MVAVITGDIVNSTKLNVNELNVILDNLKQEFEYFKGVYNCDFKIFRGDSFQGVLTSVEDALFVAITIKTAINRVATSKKSTDLFDVRLAIGVGTIDLQRDSILESNGEAFQFSGRTLETMKGDYPKMLLKTAISTINDEFDVHFNFLETVTSKWSRESAEVIYWLLHNQKEREVSELLGISQPAVNYRKKAANWDAVAMLLKRYKTVINHLTHGS